MYLGLESGYSNNPVNEAIVTLAKKTSATALDTQEIRKIFSKPKKREQVPLYLTKGQIPNTEVVKMLFGLMTFSDIVKFLNELNLVSDDAELYFKEGESIWYKTSIGNLAEEIGNLELVLRLRPEKLLTRNFLNDIILLEELQGISKAYGVDLFEKVVEDVISHARNKVLSAVSFRKRVSD